MIAHIIPTSAAAILLLFGWGAAGLGVLTGIVLMITELNRRRLGAVLLAGSALIAVLVGFVTRWPPTRPLYTISLAQPRAGDATTSPVVILVCGRLAGGAGTVIPGADRVVSVSLDGKQTEVAHSPLLALQASAGRHRLRVEILSGDHREFVPPLTADAAIEVSGEAPPALSARCGA